MLPFEGPPHPHPSIPMDGVPINPPPTPIPIDGVPIICLNIGTPKNINFPFGTNGKLMVLCVPILKYFRICEKVMTVHLDLKITIEI